MRVYFSVNICAWRQRHEHTLGANGRRRIYNTREPLQKVRNCVNTLHRKVLFHFTIPRCAQLPVFYGPKRRHRKVGSLHLRQFKILVFKRGHFTIRSLRVENHNVSVTMRCGNSCRPPSRAHAWQKRSQYGCTMDPNTGYTPCSLSDTASVDFHNGSPLHPAQPAMADAHNGGSVFTRSGTSIPRAKLTLSEHV